MNKLIIEQFTMLTKQIQADHTASLSKGDNKEATKHAFRLKSIKNALNALKKVDFEIVDANDVKNVNGIGKGSLERINEILTTGKLKEISEDVNEKVAGILELSKVIGIGNKKANYYATKYNIKSIKQLKDAHDKNKIILDDKVILGLKYYGVIQKNIPRKEITMIRKYLQRIGKDIDDQLEIEICGSYRRGSLESGDIDVIMFHPYMKKLDHIKNPIKYDLINYLESFVTFLSESGFLLDHMTDKNFKMKYMGFCKYKLNPVRRIDIRLMPYDSMSASLLYFTGPVELNIVMRKEAQKKDMLLNEYGLFKKEAEGSVIPIKTKIEKDIFTKLGMPYLTPIERNIYSNKK